MNGDGGGSIVDEDLDFSIFDDEDTNNGNGDKQLSLKDIYRDSVNQSIKKRYGIQKEQQEKKEKGAWFQDDMWQ